MGALLRDLSYAFRLSAGKPAFSAVAILTLAPGTGANTAIFSLVHGILLGSVPFEESERLVFLGAHSEQVPNMSVSYPNLLDWRERNRSFEGLGGAQLHNLQPHWPRSPRGARLREPVLDPPGRTGARADLHREKTASAVSASPS